MAVDSRFGLGLRAEDKGRSRERDIKSSLAEETERKYCLLRLRQNRSAKLFKCVKSYREEEENAFSSPSLMAKRRCDEHKPNQKDRHGEMVFAFERKWKII